MDNTQQYFLPDHIVQQNVSLPPVSFLSTFRPLNLNQRFGVPLDAITSLPYNTDLFDDPRLQWNSHEYSKAGRPILEQLNPSPAVLAPEGTAYPQASVYTLGSSDMFTRHFFYHHDYHETDYYVTQARVNSIIAPPNCEPRKEDDQWVFDDENHFLYDDIPGSLQMQLDIPYVAYVNGNRARPVTVAAAQTLRSLQNYSDGVQIAEDSRYLYALTFGTPDDGVRKGIPSIYSHNLKTNMRWAGTPGCVSPYDGSYN